MFNWVINMPLEWFTQYVQTQYESHQNDIVYFYFQFWECNLAAGLYSFVSIKLQCKEELVFKSPKRDTRILP